MGRSDYWPNDREQRRWRIGKHFARTLYAVLFVCAALLIVLALADTL